MKKPSAIPRKRKESGFSLVELLISMSILAVVTMAIFSLYNMQHKTTHIEEDVVDVQQNLKMALDNLSRDVRMAGFVVLGGVNPIGAVTNNAGLNSTDTILLNTASSTGAAARISVDLITNVTTTATVTLTVASAGQLNLFSAGDIVRIINPGERSEPVSAYFTVSSKDASVPSITLTPSGIGTAVLFKRGFLIVKTGSSAPDTFPNTVLYCVGPAAGCGPSVTTCPAGQSCLMRIVNNSPDDDSIVATNVQDFQLRYISDGSASEADTPANLALVRACRATFTGQTVQTAQLSQGAKSREATIIMKIRNR
ncbi:MAG: prepilin-type N-terminal cleavage/methylation domain-containing protein [Deltaproteobacteria bacterium]|nr:prepilin-type N-terminal cleavage/methylation domain-containing protein [Deltaproteobacteria bacterium]